MKKTFIAALSTLVLFGCAAGNDFAPKTVQGAQCKANCAKDMNSCAGSSYTCDRAAATCMKACSELDAIVDKK